MLLGFLSNFFLERVPKPFDFIGILADRCNCSYVLGQTLSLKSVRAPTFSCFETGFKSKRTRILSFRICL
ncbi:hypothetical protein IQA49_14275 [Leptospira borgpetersenii serovar Ballum]|uniref:Uncharacterized protein n=5 Tax=Leptospira borgpetersenii TaxID=174 RepID=M3F878_LEPBO|nr:hypothetical protein LBBP_04133 [Leptospira borgpetersenii serovar Ballum]EKP11881.1 hypothetical protein LEP1GSC128_1188 [Leptospira borgpetersenii str. 200801926]EKQ93422.1 hypothetical protein LEP1GSC101_0581 [Leptospira borgpetersenii str. UI 09149]EKR00941.1 hypothetical protein LEP1GSC121_1525 [Leptospira borgpetersenii serovar Castellonis str. 200801910]EMF98102.1 hypothetical protein LEP1GSC123_1114 [Leptospira borgpetersenii str. 200701203]EMK11396.1 hypothetical protein LEP1GSC066